SRVKRRVAWTWYGVCTCMRSAGEDAVAPLRERGSGMSLNLNVNWSIVEIVLTVIGYLIPIVALFIVPVNRKPTAATAWLLVMFILPYVGVLIFLLIGSPKLPRWRRAQQRTMNERIEAIAAQVKQLSGMEPVFETP